MILREGHTFTLPKTNSKSPPENRLPTRKVCQSRQQTCFKCLHWDQKTTVTCWLLENPLFLIGDLHSWLFFHEVMSVFGEVGVSSSFCLVIFPWTHVSCPGCILVFYLSVVDCIEKFPVDKWSNIPSDCSRALHGGQLGDAICSVNGREVSLWCFFSFISSPIGSMGMVYLPTWMGDFLW